MVGDGRARSHQSFKRRTLGTVLEFGSVPVAGLDEERLEVGHAFRGLVVAAALHLDLGRGGLDLGAFVG